ncbi:C40 family peptidase [Lysinibacter cavernae]|uniref:Cell wall-associated NlpC family hydrolase n=1 Tax=Lysinibacter cavernae TaxID=1640652 RepID=A0A7X5R1F7_9MICO|nr:C40 family peptidase [Lysinibacter cavernae]NIH53757.1 cell wall-associated NlpC family hydrolase [Lysinibacter cavernae]
MFSRREQTENPQSSADRRSARRKITAQSGFAILLSSAFFGTLALPAYSAEPEPDNFYFANQVDAQTLTIEPTVADSAVSVDAVGATTATEIESIVEAEEAQAAATAAEEKAAAARASAASGVGTGASATAAVRDVPVGVGAAGLIAAARAQLGEAQDCTALVERALRAIGYTVGDLGPMQFAQFGTPVDASQIQPGDIMMRAGHVGIYTGDGVNHRAIHGGFLGSTVETSADANPANYSLIVRLP